MKNKSLAVIVLLIVALSFSGCSNSKKENGLKGQSSNKASITDQIPSSVYCKQASPIVCNKESLLQSIKRLGFQFEERGLPLWCKTWSEVRYFQGSKQKVGGKDKGKIIGKGMFFKIEENDNSEIINITIPIGKGNIQPSDIPEQRDDQNNLLGKSAKQILSKPESWVANVLKMIVPGQSDSVMLKLSQFSNMSVPDLINNRHIDSYGHDSFEGFYPMPGWITIFYVGDMAFVLNYQYNLMVALNVRVTDIVTINIMKKSTFDLQQRISLMK
jgi:hypothetical protein